MKEKYPFNLSKTAYEIWFWGSVIGLIVMTIIVANG